MRLLRLGRLVAETFDELHDLALLRILLGAQFCVLVQTHAPGRLEPVVVAGIKGQLAVFQMQNFPGHPVQQVAVVADQQHRARIISQIGFQPKGRLEIEMVGRLVQQQQVGFGEQQRRQRHAHAPAA